MSGGGAARAERPPRPRRTGATAPRGTARARPPSSPRYYALTVPGIEDLASAELERAGVKVEGTLARFDKRDSIVLFGAADLRRVLRCGLIEDVFQVLLDVPTPGGRSAPKELSKQLDRGVLEAAMTAHHALRPKRGGRSYKVVARVAGRQPFLREDVEREFARGIGLLLPHWVPAGGATAIEVWVHVIGERTLAGLRLSGDELAQRTYKRAHLPASLKPSVARALVALSAPQAGDVVLDPMCGAGTVLRERAEAGIAKLIVGGDSVAEAIAASRENARKQAALVLWDATRLPLRNGCVDVVITNPPYGRQHEAIAGLDRLYSRALREAARVLRPDGRCVVLTGEADVLRRALPASLRVQARRRMLLRGLAVTAFVMVRGG